MYGIEPEPVADHSKSLLQLLELLSHFLKLLLLLLEFLLLPRLGCGRESWQRILEKVQLVVYNEEKLMDARNVRLGPLGGQRYNIEFEGRGSHPNRGHS